MAKDWRLAVCTRWRPLVTVLLISGFIFIGIGIKLLVDAISPNIYDKAESLAIGMTEKQLIEIMGSPSHTETVNTLQVVSRLPGPPQDFKDVVDAHERVIEYTFVDKRDFGTISSLLVGGIYLDEERHSIVLLQLYIGILEFSVIHEPFLLLMSCIALPLLGLWFWCKRVGASSRKSGQSNK